MTRTLYPWPENLLRRLDPQPDGCIYYTGYIAPRGYGQVSIRGEQEYAHRAMYRLMVGPIPFGMEINHRCHSEDTSCEAGNACLHRRCVNPGHLELVTHRENMLRSRTAMAVNAAKTHCKHGHEFTPENTYRTKKGSRACRECMRIANRKRSRAGRSKRKIQRYVNGETIPVD